MGAPDHIVKLLETPFFDEQNILATKLPEGGVQLANLADGRCHFVGEFEYGLLQLCDGKRTIKELAQLGGLPDENAMCKFLLASLSLGILGEPERRPFNILQMRLSLFNPSRILKPGGKPAVILRNFLYFASLLSIVFCIWAIISNAQYLIDFTMDAFVTRPINILLFVIHSLIIGFFHEFGHAIVLTSYGLPSVRMGVLLNFFTPAFYTDVSGINRITMKTKRIFVWLAGIMAQLVILAVTLFMILYLNISPWWKDFCLMLFLADLMLVIFNLLFVMRFDGYSIICDMLGDRRLEEDAFAFLSNPLNERNLQVPARKKYIYVILGSINRIFPFVMGGWFVSTLLPMFVPQANPVIEIVFPIAVTGLIAFFTVRRVIRRTRSRNS